MTETEKKALALVNEVRTDRGFGLITWFDREEDIDDIDREALCRAIEQHDAFRQEVSDAVEQWCSGKYNKHHPIARFILPKPDPLVEVMNEIGFGMSKTASEEFRAALAARGLEVRKIGDGE